MTTIQTAPALDEDVPLFSLPPLHEFLALGEQLAAAGYDPGPLFAKAEKINNAVLAALQEEDRTAVPLIERDPADVADLMLRTAVLADIQQTASRVAGIFEFELARSARRALHADSGKLITAMRKKFNPAADDIRTAAAAGISRHTDTADLLNTADTKTIDAYRGLVAAVDTLDQIAGLRNSMTTIGGVGPARHPAAAYIAKVATPQELQTADTILKGETRWTNVHVGHHEVSSRVPVPRLGGPWLALVHEGFALRLNTGDEAAAVVTAAHEQQ